MNSLNLTLPLEYTGEDIETHQAIALANRLKDDVIQLVRELEAVTDEGNEFAAFRISKELDQIYNLYQIESKFAFGMIQEKRYCSDE